ncbi:hypothetical protein EVAR_52626_1 [Eumeta japonica]|uniref:Ig-like domain-containing protein n=1 Tax=Eumeta variegata TaxID=151549 RepID=A0A4C1Y244_EUMVA|nr:hypothetical protein EVAR_52626_1 [Eumeta japonica]
MLAFVCGSTYMDIELILSSFISTDHFLNCDSDRGHVFDFDSGSALNSALYKLYQIDKFNTSIPELRKCYLTAARGRPIIVEWERDARHSAGLSRSPPKTLAVHVPELPSDMPMIKAEKGWYASGDSLRAQCSSAPADPPANLTWLLNGRDVSDKDMFSRTHY